jgi:hypothetical protein
MRRHVGIALGLILGLSAPMCACGHRIPPGPPAIAQRAESIAALDPASELRKALNRGDLRFIAVCGYVCVPPGVDLNDSVVVRAIRARDMHYIEGTSDAVGSEAVARLNTVGADYAERYNRLLALHLHVREDVPVTHSNPQ